MLRIRLRRTGAKKQPRYRVVVAESRAPRDGAFVEIIGWYNPQSDPAQVVINTEKASQWIERGARPSGRVAYLLKQASAPAAEPEPEPAPRTARRTSRKPKSDEAVEQAPAAEGAPATAEAETASPEAEATAAAPEGSESAPAAATDEPTAEAGGKSA